MPYERGLNYQLGLQAAGLTLCSPVMSVTLGPTLHDLTGIGHLEDWLGHTVSILAAAVIASNMLSRVVSTDGGRRHILAHRSIAPVVAVAATLLLATLAPANVTQADPDLYAVTAGGWLQAHMIIFALAAVWLLGIALWALRIIASDPAQARNAKVWMLALACGMFACLAAAANTLTVDHNETLAALVWLGAYGILGVSAAALVTSWRHKINPYRRLMAIARSDRHEAR